MRITKRTNIAMRVLMFCAVHEDERVTKAMVAKRCKTSESHLAQVIHRLAQLGYLDTQRGRNGGITLARPMTKIVIGDVFRDFETDGPGRACLADADGSCPLISVCRLRHILNEALEAFYACLDGATLDNLICGNNPLFELLMVPSCNEINTLRKVSQ